MILKHGSNVYYVFTSITVTFLLPVNVVYWFIIIIVLRGRITCIS